MPGSQPNKSRRRRRLKPTPTFPQMVGDWRSARVAPGTSQIWVAAADGSDARQLTHNTRNGQARPHGRQMDAQSPSIVGTLVIEVRIWTVDAEGGTPRQITTGPGSQTVPRWSHDGRWIYFANHQTARGTSGVCERRAGSRNR